MAAGVIGFAAARRISEFQRVPSRPSRFLMSTRTEKDSMGEMPVPSHALYGASTQRAVLNFPISDTAFMRPFIRALGLVKAAAAHANLKLGKLPKDVADHIAAAAEEMVAGKLDDHFPIDIYQTGS